MAGEDGFVCPRGHRVPAVRAVECQRCVDGGTPSAVTYAPAAVGMALTREVKRLREALQYVLDASSQGVAVEAGELTGSVLLGYISRLAENALEDS